MGRQEALAENFRKTLFSLDAAPRAARTTACALLCPSARLLRTMGSVPRQIVQGACWPRASKQRPRRGELPAAVLHGKGFCAAWVK